VHTYFVIVFVAQCVTVMHVLDQNVLYLCISGIFQEIAWHH